MSRTAAVLLLTSVLCAQATDPAPTRGPMRSVSLNVVIPASNRSAVSPDPDQVKDDLMAFFTHNGIPVLPVEAGGSEGAYSLEVSPITLQYGEGTCLLSVSERLTRLPAPGAGPKEKPVTWNANYMAAQAGEEGLLFLTRQLVVSMAAHLVRLARGGAASPLVAQPLTASPQADAARRPPPDRPKAMALDISRVKVKTRPPAPPYPRTPLQQHMEGTVVAQITVDPEGRPARAVAISGPAELKPTALRYAMQWVFEPTRLDGEPHWAEFDLTLAFRLRGMREESPARDPAKRLGTPAAP